MTSHQLMKRIRLSDADMNEIKSEVQKAEKETTGEIALALIPESDNYNFWELLASVYFAALVFVVLLPFAQKINAFYEAHMWINSSWQLPAFYGIATLISIAIGFLLMNIPLIDRIIVPKMVQHKAVTDRAFRHFAESGVYATKENSGILIFVSYLEREVRIVADKGIAEKIPQDLWNIIADELAGGIKNRKTKEGFIGAIRKCGELLKENFPAGKDNPDELPDGLVILGE